MNLSRSQARAILALCALAVLGAGYRMAARFSRHGRVTHSMAAAPADTAAYRMLARQLEQRRLPLDINSASARMLERLEGIGPVLAGAIVEERRRGGAYSDAADLAARVSGIGPATAGSIERSVVFGGSSGPEEAQ